MKKLLALLIVLTMVMGIMPVVSAAIPQNNGFGTVQEFSAWNRNSPSGSPWIGYSVIEDETFGTLYRHTITGSNGTKNNKGPYTTYKGFLLFEKSADVTVTAGDKVFVSFYYRVNTNVDGVEYTTPKAVYTANNISQNTSTGTQLDISVTDTWCYYSAIKSIHSSPASTTDLRQYTGIYTNAYTDKVCIDIAEPTVVYLGAVTAEDNATVNEQIQSSLSTTAITSLTVDGTAVDLTANPTTYTTEEDITAESIAVTTRYGTADKVVVDVAADGQSAKVKVYAPYVDWTATDAVPSVTYTIEKLQVKDPVVTITENNGYGTAVIGGLQSPTVVGTVGREFAKLETIKGSDAAPFDEYYSWTREEFKVEGTNNQSYLAVSGELPEGAEAGDWVYVSFYYRTYNRFTNSDGEVVDNNQIDLYPSIRSDSKETPYYRTATAKYIRLSPDLSSDSDVGEWKKLAFIQKLDNATNESWTLKLSSTHIKNSDGTISGNNRKFDFADIKVVYFGTPTSDTPDTDDSFYVAAIQNAAGNYGLSAIYVDGEEVDTNTNPLSYTTYTTPRYTAREKHSVVTGDTIHGAGMANVVETDAGFTVKSYPLDYDWLSGTDNRVAAYTVNEVAEYDFYDFAINGNTFTLKADNALTSTKNGVIILASYNAMGKMLKMKAEPFSINGLGNTLSVTVPEASGVASMKVFVWDGIASSVPYVKTIVVEDITTGNIIQ